MARIKNSLLDGNPMGILEAMPVNLKNFSLRLDPAWKAFLKSKAAKLSAERNLKVKEADLIREAIYQCWIKPTQDKKAA